MAGCPRSRAFRDLGGYDVEAVIASNGLAGCSRARAFRDLGGYDVEAVIASDGLASTLSK